ncbi:MULTISPECIES: DUF4458 domain-containing protein [unclassified Carboxylicivirga]|uniref:DUF4458 domain-containing protein n=1 Tax=Carboxylicivirga TaxID=1628153 RepID=UPI003D333B2A
MKSKIMSIKGLVLFGWLMALSLTFGACSDDDVESLQAEYGYAQFKLFKSGSYLKSSAIESNRLQYLGEAEKMKIVLLNNQDGSEVTQTVSLRAMGGHPELGLRSDKLKLMAGDYAVVGFFLYKAEGQELKPIFSGEPEEKTVLGVTKGGLTVQDIVVKVVERGSASFSLKKNIVAEAKAAANADKYQFSQVRYATLYLENQFNKAKKTLGYLPFSYQQMYNDEGVLTGVAKSDSILSLKAGQYKVLSYTLYDANKRTLDADMLLDETLFEVKDNAHTGVDVAVNIHRSAAYIQDYLALRQIWEALDGPNWSYEDQQFPVGTNWDFNKEIDLWGQQPGVGLNAKGRVAVLNLGSFGARGKVPAAIGQLTELTVLTLGTHSDPVGGNMPEQWEGEVSPAQKLAWRNDYYNRFIKKDVKASFSEPLRFGFELMGDNTPAEAPANGMPSISTKDVVTGTLTNGITGVSSEISKLTKLQQLFIANGKFSDFDPGTDFSLMIDLTDVELYNCPSMTALPAALFTMPNIELLNLANNPQVPAAAFEAGLDQLAQSPTAAKLQILYLRNNRLTTLPGSIRNFKKLGKLDCAYNELVRIPAFGKEINLVQLNMDHNQITEIPTIDGYYCGYEDVETFSFAHNKLTVFPDIFNARSMFTMESVDFSFNEISSIEGGDSYNGIRVTTLVLAGNRLSAFPAEFASSNSTIKMLNLRGNGMKTFPKGVLSGENSFFLESLDLTFNELTELPSDFNAVTLPYLYGIDLSHNRFDHIPRGPLNVSRLTVFAFRNQRDADGLRIMRQWPKGISTCPSLRALYLGGNDLRKVDDTISPNIYMFEIKDNPNISIDISNVCPYIRAGYYNLIYDRTQDIRGCDYLDLI